MARNFKDIYRKRLDREVESYQRERQQFPYLPELTDYKEEESTRQVKFWFEIPDHLPFEVAMNFTEMYPHKAPNIEIRPMPVALSACSLGSSFLIWSGDNNHIALCIIHRVLDIYSLVMEYIDRTKDVKGKGKLKEEEEPKIPEVLIEQERRKQNYIKLINSQEKQYQDDLSKAIELSLTKETENTDIELENMTFKRPRKVAKAEKSVPLSISKSHTKSGDNITKYFQVEKRH